MIDDFETRLTASLHADAERGPESPQHWLQRPANQPTRDGRRALLAAACLALLAAGGVWFATERSSSTERMATIPSVVPASDPSGPSERPATGMEADADPVTTATLPTSSIPAATGSGATSSTVARSAFGGSVMAAAEIELADMGFVVAADSRPTIADLVDSVTAQASAGGLGSAVVIDPTIVEPISFDQDDLDELAAVVAPIDRVVLIASNDTGEITEDNNARLEALAASNPNIAVLDWPAASYQCACTYRNRLDLRDVGSSLYAQLAAAQIDPGFDDNTIRATPEEIRTLLPQMTAPAETIIDTSDAYGTPADGSFVKVFGAPDRVCIADVDPDGGAGSACTSEPTEGLMYLWSNGPGTPDESSTPTRLVALHHASVEMTIDGCDVRTVLLDEIDAALSSCVPGDATSTPFLDVEFRTPDAIYLVTLNNIIGAWQDVEVSHLYNTTVDDWVIADTVPEGYEYDALAESASNRQTEWVNAEGDRLTVTQVLYPAGSAPDDTSGLFVGTDDAGGTSISISATGTRIDVYATGLDLDLLRPFVESLRIGTRDEVPRQIVSAADPGFGGDLVFVDVQRGQVASVYAKADGDGWCVDSPPGGGGCPAKLPPGLPITAHGGGYSYYIEDSMWVEAGASGLASNDVAIIEVRFVDGTILEVRPTDLSGEAGVRFWNVVARLKLDAPLDRDGSVAFVDTITAYDNSGRPIALDSGNGRLVAIEI